MTSFISERTAEYYLVPPFRALLASSYTHVLPFFYWKTREGNIQSRMDDFPSLLTACALFPRRPKIEGERVEMTVNEEVHIMSRLLLEAGIPTFLGFPRVQSLSDFASEFECLWFCSRSSKNSYSSHEIFPGMLRTPDSELLGPFRGGSGIQEYLVRNAARRTWYDLLYALSEVHSKYRDEVPRKNPFMFGPVYKPTYFLMW